MKLSKTDTNGRRNNRELMGYKIENKWDISRHLTTQDVNIGADNIVRINEKGAIRVTLRLLAHIMAESNLRELTQDEKQKIVICMEDVIKVMKGTEEKQQDGREEDSRAMGNDEPRQ